ncbi:HD-GYP domain-containing protein [Salisediminibacterium selenitireducens]|uniref:Metal dependent phosphohydrolase n=1 Tax=Bacillus selenitireducens (strain ATCC 700615 / DSM 15326 / MLS10) TaxID=439292 RepID=D6Y0X3_BACIE|nr:HD domain-containing phosphohydrolase [Salisediminibacterium selenitireducens]ADH98577.1 metal dependent phosphohydrolase [[Bacillus] selenitireducens MLS10]
MEWIRVADEPHKLIDRVLADNVISDEGLTLLREGMVVRGRHIPMLRRQGIEMIPVGSYAPVLDQIDQKFHEHYPRFADTYKRQFGELKSCFSKIQQGDKADLDNAIAMFTELAEEALESVNLFEVLQQMHGHNEYTYRHSIHVGLLGALVGKLMKWPSDQIVRIGHAGLLHDIGKIRISNAIIDKPDKLTPVEFAEIKKHCELGHELLINYMDAHEDLLDGTLYHHERMDGSGYPFGLMSGDIPDIAQVLGVVDVFDAVSSDRAYHRKSSPLAALGVVISEVYQGKLSAKYGLPFIQYMLDAYTGSTVILSDGRVAQVVRIQMEEVENPLIRLNDQVVSLRSLKDVEILDVLDQASKKAIGGMTS